jgi:DNA-binding MarR family transcriptional regulator
MEDCVLDSVEHELALLVRRVTSISSDKSIGNLDRSAYLLLNQITVRGSIGVKALADQFHLDISTVSRQTAALELKGYIIKKPDPADRRAYFLELTELGRLQLVEYKRARSARITAILRDWSEDERQSFGQLLRKFNHTPILETQA